jgi:hypothetical protein
MSSNYFPANHFVVLLILLLCLFEQWKKYSLPPAVKLLKFQWKTMSGRINTKVLEFSNSINSNLSVIESEVSVEKVRARNAIHLLDGRIAGHLSSSNI